VVTIGTRSITHANQCSFIKYTRRPPGRRQVIAFGSINWILCARAVGGSVVKLLMSRRRSHVPVFLTTSQSFSDYPAIVLRPAESVADPETGWCGPRSLPRKSTHFRPVCTGGYWGCTPVKMRKNAWTVSFLFIYILFVMFKCCWLLVWSKYTVVSVCYCQMLHFKLKIRQNLPKKSFVGRSSDPLAGLSERKKIGGEQREENEEMKKWEKGGEGED